MNKINYQKELERLLIGIEKSVNVPSLMLHSCCAPCSSYVLEYLCRYFRITVLYYNPNIITVSEYKKRVEEQLRLIAVYNEEGRGYPIEVMEGDYEPNRFLETVKGLEGCAEGGERCFRCYEMRLRKTAEAAFQGHFDYFTTTLTISPMKNAEKINEIGRYLEAEYQTAWLVSDFKKRDGYKRSIELSHKYNLYRQDFCGCAFSKKAKLHW